MYNTQIFYETKIGLGFFFPMCLLGQNSFRVECDIIFYVTNNN